MQATLDAFSLKAFTKALTCLQKYGDELSVYATPESLSFSATNSSKSAYCRFKYEKQFFSRYRLGGAQTVKDDGDDEVQEVQNVTGQIMTKSLLSILKHKTVEKSVERCELSIMEGNDQDGEDEDNLESRMVVRLHCKHGIIKTHRLLLLTPASLMAPGVPDSTNESRITIGPKSMSELFQHFSSSKSAKSDPQLIWTFEENEVGLQSMESSIESRGKGQLMTEISLGTEQFDVYDIYEAPITIAFHFREFNATLAFADSMSLSIDLRFTDPAAPLFIDVEGDNVETLFVISTSQVHGAASSTQRTNTQTTNTKKREREQSSNETPRTKKPMKVVQPVDPDTYSNRSHSVSRSNSHVPGSMPPPSFVPNRSSYQVPPSTGFGNNSAAGPSKQKEPLFLPSSQMSAADEEVLKSTGLGIETMNANELADLLDGEGEEVDFTYVSQVPSSQYGEADSGQGGDYMQVDEPDSLELVEDGLTATQISGGADKVFQPLFED